MVTRSYHKVTSGCYELSNDKTKNKQDKNSISRIYGLIYILTLIPTNENTIA